MTLLKTTRSGFSKEERGKRHYLTAILLLSALAMPQAVIAMDAEQEHESRERTRQEKLDDAVSALNELENLLQHKGWELSENNGVMDWQPGQQVEKFNNNDYQEFYTTLSTIQKNGDIRDEQDLSQRACAIAHALSFKNLAKAFSMPTDNFFDDEVMPPEMLLKIFEHAAGDGTVTRTPEQLRTLLNLSEVNTQTHDDVSKWRQYEKEVVDTVKEIQANGWPENDNLILRAQINDRVLQRLVDENYFDNEIFIDLSHTGITDVGLASLAQLSNLKHLILNGCTSITGEGLESLERAPEFVTLELGDCTRITDVGLESFAQLSNLKYLNLSGCTGITDKGLKSLARLQKLKELNLSGCTGITDKGLKSVAQLQKLKLLFLSGCIRITSDALNKLSIRLRKTRKTRIMLKS